ncbi:mannonate dehydratase [Mahella sp.]|uniref:mannonate dehydratase n=1 Tax=Mahella sp. TaxID=2798721 RepID=UPI0025BBB22A|nr:mannonate dehydratase [Mahella sp.]MBZ4665632.1 D-mannonate dehydratase [Mahella sp.]
MKMSFRWFGEGQDNIPLQYIRQIPGMYSIVTSLIDIPVGEVWPIDRLKTLKEKVNAYGLHLDVIESVNIHEDIKLGLKTRDRYIQAYIDTMKNLHEIGVKVICYNFMPVLDWVRTELERKLEDGSYAMAYKEEDTVKIDPKDLNAQMEKQSGGFSLPGWEPDRLKEMSTMIEKYKYVSEQQYWNNIKYFLDGVIPYAEKYDIKLAIHPDDPPWPIFGLPRVITNRQNIQRFLDLNKSPYNGLTLCTGSLGANRENDLPSLIREFGSQGRIHFAHIRNIKYQDGRDFHETAHLSQCGSLDMFEIVKAFYDVGFDGYVRPDHGRMIWGEKGRPGYGLYDRALGAVYIQGLLEAIDKMTNGR